MVLVTAGLLLATPQPADAQCGGASNSTCLTCHQDQYPVDALGQWHIDHAGEDYCHQCHAGAKVNNAEEAHATMVDPLESPQRCIACHPADYEGFMHTYQELRLTAPVDDPPDDATTVTTNDDTHNPLVATADGSGGYDGNIILAGLAILLTGVSGAVIYEFEFKGRNQ